MSNMVQDDIVIFDRQLREFREQLGNSQRLLKQAPVPYRELLIEAFSNVDLSLEELQVAEHEMRQQYHALENSQQTVAYERERYRRLFHFAPDGYLVTDAAGVIQEANRAAAIMFRLENGYLRRKPLASFVAPPYRGAFRRDLISLSQFDFLPEFEVVLQPRNGEPFTASLTASADKDTSGNLTAIRWLIRDVSERKRWQDRIMTVDSELESLVDERTVELKNAYARERRVAEVLQTRLLEDIREDAFPGILLSTCYLPAGGDALVGGDFYDVCRLPNGQIALVVGDVSGKGLDAASRTAEIKYTLRGLLRRCEGVRDALGELNAYLCENRRGFSDQDIFVTLCLAVTDTSTGAVRVGSAGAERPFIARSTWEIELVDVSGVPLGAFAESVFEESASELRPGDRLILMTDGIPEARRGAEMLGVDGVYNLIGQTRNAPDLSTVVGKIIAGARRFAAGSLQDDACILVAERG